MKLSKSLLPLKVNILGFTLIELMITLTLLSILALTALPLAEIIGTKAKEHELRLALRQIRGALDKYKDDSDRGQFGATSAGSSGYPASLEILTLPLTVKSKGADEVRVYLRAIPRDPFHPDPTLSPSSTWKLRSYASPVDDPQPGIDVFDVTSQSQKTGLNGVRYDQW
jgi:general secretion pathway protein G